MKKIQIILILCVVAFICSTSCKNDDGGDLVPVNRSPGTFEITTIISDNSADLTWTPAVDPDGDVVTYDIVLEGDTVASDIK